MTMRRCLSLVPHGKSWVVGLLVVSACLGGALATAADGNRFAYLDEPLDPYYPHRNFPKLTTPQWVGEAGVECVVTLGIDDMRDPAKYELYLRPILERLKQIDGRAPVSIMTNRVAPDDPQVQSWLAEGLSIECHTIDHPCPCLQGGDFAKARGTYERCVDLMHSIPNNRPVAFRMPCCDSLNTPSPRFWAEVFEKTTEQGKFLQLDTSVFNVITGDDPALPESIRLNEQGESRFRRYIPFPSFVNTIEDYPYPYVIGRLCWEFPCVVPSDWSAQFVQKPNNPDTVRDLKLALDACVLKQGTFNLVFHPHGWIRAEQIVELIDHAVVTHGSKVKFLNFRECLDRINQHLLQGKPLRDSRGRDQGVRFVDLNADGYLDVLHGLAPSQSINANSTIDWWIWQSGERKWMKGSGTVAHASNANGDRLLHRYAALHTALGPTHSPFPSVVAPAPENARPGTVAGMRFRDLDGDGVCELLDGSPAAGAVYAWEREKDAWKRLPFSLPAGVSVVDEQGRDRGFRLVDIDQDGSSDILFSNAERYGVYLYRDLQHGWSVRALEGRRDDLNRTGPEVPLVVRGDGTNNGAWFHSAHLWIQNEDTQRLPNHVDRLAWADILKPLREREATAQLPPTPIGAAKIDITPTIPVRLSGYGNRRQEATEVAQRLWAKALAIGDDGGLQGPGPALLITLENCGLTPAIRDAVIAALQETFRIQNERVVITATHTHTAPCLTDWAPFLFGDDLPSEHQQHVDQYTQDLIKKLIEVARQALAVRRPGRLTWGEGNVPFAINRRVVKEGKWTGFGVQADGPVDHSLPVLAARDEQGKLIAVVANYACHCTTLGGDWNQIHGDWAGYAQEMIEQDHEGCVALITIGCGADANPQPRRTDLELCKQHGRQLADEVKRLLATELTPLDPQLNCRLRHVELPFDLLPTEAEWQERAKQSGAPGYHARQFLSRLQRGESLPKTLRYPVASWTFGDDLAMVFLGGEVVVDYAIRLKTELDASKLWITAYANDVCCYIPSQRILREGGYEADYSMYFYARPTRLSGEVEAIILDTVQKLLPHVFYSASKQAEFPPPKSPEEARAAIQVQPGFRVELVAAEPLVQDPVAFDWGPDGSLWVAEMRDYPNGLTWNGPNDPRNVPGGRIKRLRDTNGDGRYDTATLFLDQLSYPNGVKAWRSGVLITAAPHVIYAEDRDGDGRADHQEILYEGFVEGNQQHRVNGLRWGLDNWLYLANGDSGGTIRSVKTDERLAISGRDLRIRPDTGEFETQAGQTQFGRNRDDWGAWFGGNNSNPMWHYVLEDHYLRRNPHVAPPENRKHVSVQPGASPVFPASRTLSRFNDFNMSNRFTSACSPEVYRDDYLFADSPDSVTAERATSSHVVICEPVHNLVHHEQMTAEGVSFSSQRSADEQQSEFFASSDNWSRPVMVRTGPDGALWVADMYRAVIEHPEWIPKSWQQKLDLRAGSELGRIYRIVREDAAPRPITRLDQRDALGLVAALDSPSGWQRDMAQQMLLWRFSSGRADAGRPAEGKEKSAAGELAHEPAQQLAQIQAERQAVVAALTKMAREATRALARLHAICTLDGLHALTPDVILSRLQDPHPGVRRHAVRLAETMLPQADERDVVKQQVGEQLLKLARDEDAKVRLQVAYSLGRWDARGARGLAQIALQSSDQTYLLAAVMSSVHAANLQPLLTEVLSSRGGQPPLRLIEPLLGLVPALDTDQTILNQTMRSLTQPRENRFEAWQIAALAAMLDVGDRRRTGLDTFLNDTSRQAVIALFAFARQQATSDEASESDRLVALRVLGRGPEQRDEDLTTLASLLSPRQSQAIQLAAASALAKLRDGRVPQYLLSGWASHSPTLRVQILDTLLSRDEWTGELLTALERAELPRAQIDARRQQQLLSSKSESVRKRAEKIFSAGGTTSRQAALDQYAAARTLAGDETRGKQTFAKRCAACHRLDGVGHPVGPDLAALGNKTPESLVLSILDPNRAIEDRYLDYVLVTDDGQTLSGILSSETGTSLTLVGQEGKATTVLRQQIEELRSTGKSLMPEGLEKEIPLQEMADLLAYLRGTAPPPKSFPGNQPELVKPDERGTLRLLATTARIYGPKLVFEDSYRNLGWWSDRQDHAIWSLEVRVAGRYVVSLDYACQDEAAGGRFLIEVDGQTMGGQVEGTGTWDNYRSKTIGTIELSAGTHELLIRSDGPIRSALIDLRGIRLIPSP